MAKVPISELLGPRVEGVVSPNAGRSTIRNALSGLRLVRRQSARNPGGRAGLTGPRGGAQNRRTAAPRGSGGPSTQPTPGAKAPSPAQSPAEAPETGSLPDLTVQAIRDAIAALEAQYGLSIDQLAQAEGDIGEQARILLQQLDEQIQLEQEALVGSLLRRGLFTSGIALREMERAQRQGVQRKAEVERQKGTRLRQIEGQRQQLSIDLEQQKNSLIQEVLLGNLDPEVAQALLDELETLTVEDIQNAIGG